MKEISIKELTKENFDKYGSFSKMLMPEGIHLGDYPCEFYRDMNRMNISSQMVGFSVTRTYKREPVITELEYHNYTSEALMPMDGDIYIHVAPATGNGSVPYDKIEVFHVEKGTLVTLRPGTWHTGAFTLDQDIVNVLIVLPERCYENDCHIVPIPDEEQVLIKR